MVTRILALLMICVFPATDVGAVPAQANRQLRSQAPTSPSPSGYVVQAVAHGVRLTLILSKRVFAADEITRATVRVDNLTHRALVIDHRCGTQNPAVTVRAADGFVLYPPPVVYLSAPARCQLHTTMLGGDSSLVSHPYVIVRAKHVQASVTLAPKSVQSTGPGPGPSFVVRTSEARVDLVPADKPAVQLCSFSNLCANVEPPPGPVGLKIHGPLLYGFTAQCGSRQVPRYIQSVWLQPAPVNDVFKPPRYRVYPGCERPATWNFVVGWLGTPATHIHFVR
jgi:hypothetical protein